MKIIPLKYDFCVKEVMENEIVRKHFISDVLGIPLEDIKSVRIMNPFLWKRYKKQKLGILDVQLELNDNTKINIELQLRKHSYWKNRTIFYLAKMFTADLRRGEKYEKLKKCVVITILDFDMDERKEYHSVYMLRDDYGNLYTDMLELHTIELKKQPNRKKPSPLNEWHSLFNAETEEDLNMIKSGTKNLGIIEAIKELKEISLTDRIRYEYEMRLKAKRDREAEDEYVYDQGKEEGLKLGKEEGLKLGKQEGLKLGKEEGLKLGKREGLKQGEEKGREQGIRSAINIMRRNKCADEQIVDELMTEYGLCHEEALEKLNQSYASGCAIK